MIAVLNPPLSARSSTGVFLRSLSNHHFSALAPSSHCTVKSDLDHDGLRRYCENIVVVQKNGITDTRKMLCKRYSDCSFVPMAGHQRKNAEF